MPSDGTSDPASFTRRALIAIGLAALALVLLVFLQHVAKMLLILFAGILFGVFLAGLTEQLRRRTPLPRWASLTLVVVVLLGLFAGFAWLAGPRISDQVTQLGERIPQAIAALRGQLESTSWGQALLSNMPSSGQVLGAGTAQRVMGAFSTAAGALTNALIILVLGLYLAASPGLYLGGIVRLVPPSRRDRAGEVINTLGRALRLWLAGRIASMTVVAICTAVGLYLIGIDLALSLGLIAGLFSFVPYLGPILGAVPAILVGLTYGTSTALYVVVVFIVVQLLESNLITPLIQQRVVSLPPALLIAAQVFLGVLAGMLGVLVATPLAVSVIVLVQMLYVEDTLGDRVSVMGEHPDADV